MTDSVNRRLTPSDVEWEAEFDPTYDEKTMEGVRAATRRRTDHAGLETAPAAVLRGDGLDEGQRHFRRCVRQGDVGPAYGDLHAEALPRKYESTPTLEAGVSHLSTLMNAFAQNRSGASSD